MKTTRITTNRGVTTIKTTHSWGCLTFLALLVILFLPAASFGAWAVPAYVGLGVAIVAVLGFGIYRASPKQRRLPQPPPVAPPPAP